MICYYHIKACGGSYEIYGELCKNTTTCFCNNDEICLIGGSCKAGNIILKGKPVCDTNWDLKDANIFCQTMGFKGAKTATKGSRCIRH